MEASSLIKASQPSVCSPDGLHVATLVDNRIQIRRVSSLEIVRSIQLPTTTAKFLCLRWSPVTRGTGTSNRVLVADDDKVRVWDLLDDQWSATIDNGNGGTGTIANVEFGSDDTEILVFSSFGALLTVWSLWTGRSIEIKDPKFSTKGYGRNRPGRTGIFALLSRPGPQDVITLHAPDSYAVIKSFAPASVDAQGLKWSPDGRWLAVWDAASTGYKVFIYTADGNLFRTYVGDYFDDELAGLGVKSIEWSPNSDCIAIGGYEKTITLLSTRTFSPAVHLSHPTSVTPWSSTVHIEHATPDTPNSRFFALATAPTSLPTSTAPVTSTSPPPIGASQLIFNADGSLLATKSDSHPTTAWIWDLSTLRSRAVVILHNTIKRLAWHPSDPDMLMIQCINADNSLVLWDSKSADGAPHVLDLPADARLTAKADAKWLATGPMRKPAAIVSDSTGALLVWPDGRDVGSPQLVGQDGHDSDNDSLYDILTGKNAAAAQTTVIPEFTNDFAQVDDTFQFRKGVGVF